MPSLLRSLQGVFSRQSTVATEERSAAIDLVHPSKEQNWAGLFGIPASASGMSVTPETAMRVSAVHACVAVIAGTIATLPLHLYRRTKNGGKERATDHPLYSLLHDAPNELHTSCEFRDMMQAHLCLRGNAYARIIRDGAGRVTSLIPLHPDRVTVYRSGMVVSYLYRPIPGEPGDSGEYLAAHEVMHVRGLGPDGILGYSPIALARDAIGLSMATEGHGSKLFANGARPSGVLETPPGITDAQMKAMREHWEKMHAGVENSNRLAVLAGGMKYAGISMSNDEAQFLETRKFQVTDIARIFRVPPHKIADMAAATFSNIEHQSIEFVTDCIRPHAVRWEQRIAQALLTPNERGIYFAELSLDGLLRGDMKSRYEAYNIGRTGGWLSPNDVRDMENLNRIDQGDTYMQPLNMAPLGSFQPSKQPAPTQPV